jgi:thioredoxin 1
MSQNKKLRNAIVTLLQAGHGVDMRADLSVYPSEGSFLVECFLGDETLDLKGLSEDQVQQATETGEVAEYYATAEEAADGYLVLYEWLDKAIQKSAAAQTLPGTAAAGKGKKEEPPSETSEEPGPGVGLIDLTLEDLQELGEEPTLVLVLSPWSAPDRVVLAQIEGLVRNYPEVQFGRIGIDEEPEVLSRYQLSATPTVLFFKGGKLVRQLSGPQKEKELRSALDGLRS